MVEIFEAESRLYGVLIRAFRVVKEDRVLRITDDALAAMSEMLSKEDAPADVAIRFVLDGEELAMKTDSESPGDTAFQHEDRTVLLIDGRLAEVLADSTLDFSDEGFELSSDEES